MENRKPYPTDGLKAVLTDTLEDLAQYLKFQNDLGNSDVTISREARALIEKWGTPSWRSSHTFSFQGPESAALMVVDSETSFFEGAAGGLLAKILKAMHLAPDRVFICSASDIGAIRTHLRRYSPKCILGLGEKAGHRLVSGRDALADFRGKFFSFENIPVMVTHHPGELLNNPGLKRHVWDDVQQVMAKIGV
ncbi:MAG: uracil-DNA glycosylase [Desulfobacter sp.]|nr:MAG: uracil-DNA glycosylase [Desulfobacter sp.]